MRVADGPSGGGATPLIYSTEDTWIGPGETGKLHLPGDPSGAS